MNRTKLFSQFINPIGFVLCMFMYTSSVGQIVSSQGLDILLDKWRIGAADSLSLDFTEKGGEDKMLTQFEGQITYALSIKDKTGEMSVEETKMFMGDEQVYTMKGNKYRSEMNGMLNMTQIYLGQDTIYSQMLGAEAVYWIDATRNTDQMIDYKIEQNVETIAGVECDLLTINSEEGTTKYYFNKKYYSNAKNFKRHKYGFWNFCMDKTNAIPLKSSIESKDMFIEVTAKNINEAKVSDEAFEIPNLPREANPE